VDVVAAILEVLKWDKACNALLHVDPRSVLLLPQVLFVYRKEWEHTSHCTLRWAKKPQLQQWARQILILRILSASKERTISMWVTGVMTAEVRGFCECVSEVHSPGRGRQQGSRRTVVSRWDPGSKYKLEVHVEGKERSSKREQQKQSCGQENPRHFRVAGSKGDTEETANAYPGCDGGNMQPCHFM
jgi:hypothetical protein